MYQFSEKYFACATLSITDTADDSIRKKKLRYLGSDTWRFERALDLGRLEQTVLQNMRYWMRLACNLLWEPRPKSS